MLDNIPAKRRLIVALDFNTTNEAMGLVTKLGDQVEFYKVGWQLFFGSGFETINELTKLGKRVFLDLKMTDIPATIEQAIRNAPSKSVDFIELMTLSGGLRDLAEAARRASTGKPLRFLMLTALSSVNDQDIKDLYGKNMSLEKLVTLNAQRALDAECDGLIASGRSVKMLRDKFKDKNFIIVTPGIRPEGSSINDHKRTLTPYQAIKDGADYLVVGRPITQSPDPRKAAADIIKDIQRAMDERSDDSNGEQTEDTGPLARLAAG